MRSSASTRGHRGRTEHTGSSHIQSKQGCRQGSLRSRNKLQVLRTSDLSSWPAPASSCCSASSSCPASSSDLVSVVSPAPWPRHLLHPSSSSCRLAKGPYSWDPCSTRPQSC